VFVLAASFMLLNLLFSLVPTNLVHPLISSEPLANPLPPSASSPHPALLSNHPLPSPSDPEALTAAVEAITKLYAAAKNPVVLVDAIAERIGVEELVMELVEATGMTVFVSPMGKGPIDENHPQFGGVSIIIDSTIGLYEPRPKALTHL
jgi:pyruvate decarboxylase